MADVMTFATLRADVADYLERGQSEAADAVFYPQIEKCINRAERRIARDLKIQGLQATATSAFVNGTAVYAKPSNWRQTISINFGSGSGNNTRNVLQSRNYEFLTTIYPNRTSTGTPRFYADYDVDHFIIFPTPSAAAPFEILYYAQPDLLDENNGTNWLTENAPHLLLYAALSEGALFLKMIDKAQAYEQVYTQHLQGVQVEDIQKAIDRAAVRRSA
jgi:hypothetical protein